MMLMMTPPAIGSGHVYSDDEATLYMILAKLRLVITVVTLELDHTVYETTVIRHIVKSAL